MDSAVWALMICSENLLKTSVKTSYLFFPTSIWWSIPCVRRSVEVSCHEKCDLIGLLAELIEKFAGGYKFIHRVQSLCRLPEKTLRPHATLTYIVGLCSNGFPQIDIHWNGELKKSDDLSFPKAMFALESIQDILGKKNRLMSSFRSGRNGCTSYEDSNNSKTIAYDDYKRSSSQYPTELNRLVQVLFQEAKNIPLAVVQVKKAINWDWICKGNQIAFTMLCLRHLDETEQTQFACFLTQQRICFYFPKKNLLWIDLRGIDSNILVKLMNPVEVPIPTSNKQGGFTISVQGTDTASNTHSHRLECTIGRIGAITVIPVQISAEEVQPQSVGLSERLNLPKNFAVSIEPTTSRRFGPLTRRAMVVT